MIIDCAVYQDGRRRDDAAATVRRGVASELRGARQRLEQRPEVLAVGSLAALWAILDQVVDGYGPVVAGLEHDIDQIEATVFFGWLVGHIGGLAAFISYGIGGLLVPLALQYLWLRRRASAGNPGGVVQRGEPGGGLG